MRIVGGGNGADAPDPLRKIALTREEWDLVWSLRDLPASPVKDTLVHLLRDLVAFVSHPSCAEAQADGVPCSAVSRECVQCQQVDASLALLNETLHFR